MCSKLKLYIGRKVLDSLSKSTEVLPVTLKPLIQIGSSTSNDNIEMNMSLNALEHHLGISGANDILRIQPDEIIKNITSTQDRANRLITFTINRSIFIKEVIENCVQPEIGLEPKKVLVEYSSPNVAKPFHMGHLRSTIIGNFVANLHSYFRDSVTRMNYLGDWGTQFGFIKVGVDKLRHTSESIKRDPLKILYESYVYANKLAESDDNINRLARNEFKKLENGSESDLENWKSYISYTIEELQGMYNRLGVKFDEYNFESRYNSKTIKDLIDLLANKNILQTQSDGRKFVLVGDRKVTLVKSDGTSLYLTRDVAAAIDRFKRFNFDKMYYVVENGQNDHFTALKSILHQMDFPWADRIKHVKFGRIHGMSTRKGNVVFLKDILDESKELMLQKQIESPTTKVPITDTATTDILGVTSVIINDLKQRRQKDYEFSWDKVLEAKGNTGIRLQYTHCRLCNLEKNCGATIATQCQPELIDNPEVTALVRELARFHEVLSRAYTQLEACILVVYLFHLCNYINRAMKSLKVKGENEEIASQRLLVFHTAKEVLHQGMSILGLKPLEEM